MDYGIREFIPGLPFPGHPGFPDFFIPDFLGMKTARFPGKSGTANSTVQCACAIVQ